MDGWRNIPIGEPDDQAEGWASADETVKHNLPGQDFSQGLTAWDKGWNARMDEHKAAKLNTVARIYINGQPVYTVIGMRGETEQQLRGRIEVVIAITRE